MTAPAVFDRKLLRLRRDRAAAGFAAADFLHRETAERLRDRLSLIKRDIRQVLELGSLGQVMEGPVFTADLSCQAARAAQGMALAADDEFLPFRDDSLDAVVSNLYLHWANDLPGVLAQIKRALKPDGFFLAAVAGGETLKGVQTTTITYAAADQPYAAIAAQQDGEDRAAADLARLIRLDMMRVLAGR